MNNWSDNKKWWLDLLKSLFSYLIVILISFLILDNINTKNQQKNFKWQNTTSINLSVIRDFEKDARLFYTQSYDALYANIFSNKTDKMIDDIRKWESSYQRVISNTNSLKFWLSDSTTRDFTLVLDTFNIKLSRLKEVEDEMPISDSEGTGQVKIHIKYVMWQKLRTETVDPKLNDYNEALQNLLECSRNTYNNK